MRKSEFIIPVENAVLAEIRTHSAVCIGTSRTIHSLYGKFLRCCRTVYNKRGCGYWIFLCIVFSITTRAASCAVDRKREKCGHSSQDFVDDNVRRKLRPHWRGNREIRYASPNNCLGPRSDDKLRRVLNRMGFEIPKLGQKFEIILTSCDMSAFPSVSSTF